MAIQGHGHCRRSLLPGHYFVDFFYPPLFLSLFALTTKLTLSSSGHFPFSALVFHGCFSLDSSSLPVRLSLA